MEVKCHGILSCDVMCVMMCVMICVMMRTAKAELLGGTKYNFSNVGRHLSTYYNEVT